ncbi:tetratricopeptide repeat protein [Lignipirellula cremea]|nr:tetratricopeptide repeat protein [Lignipirellula cremea]
MRRWILVPALTSAICFAMLLSSPGIACAQQDNFTRIVPTDAYLTAFRPFNAGDYSTALRAFREAAKTGVRSSEGLWVDSICYFTMLGECYYQTGDLQHALENYNFALQLFYSHRNWLIRVNFPDSVASSNPSSRAQITWGASLRTPAYANIPDRMVSLQGQFNNENVLATGGVIRPPHYFPLRVPEVVRCTAVAMSRRREIMGPTCKYDPLTGQLVEALAGRPGPPNHWSASWISLQLGLAYAAAGRTPEAAAELNKAVLIADRFDHPLTAFALLELGKLNYEAEKYDAALSYLLEATYSAAVFDRYEVMEEAFSYAALAHQAVNKAVPFAPLKNATEWARTKGSASLHATLCLLAADNLTAVGQTQTAAEYLEQSDVSLRRSEMAAGKIGARRQYLQALVHYQKGAQPAGNSAFTAAVANQRDHSLTLFQLQLADTLYRNGAVSPRVAGLLFAELLRDPDAKDWILNPLECFAILMTPTPLPLEHWLELAVARKDHDLAFEITERIRRRRFFGSLPLGGRLVSLRWILEAPDAMLTQTARLQRNDLLVRYPAYAALKTQAAAVAAKLAALPATPADEATQLEQAGLLNQSLSIAAGQEALLRDLALRREPSDYAFPRLRELAEIRSTMGPRQAALGFFHGSRYVYAWWVTSDAFHHWQIPSPPAVTASLTALLKQFGHYDKNQAVDLELLQDEDWKQQSAVLLSTLLGNDPAIDWDAIDELVIIPDGVLWYAPFEALHAKHDGRLLPLYRLVKVRCAPLLSLAVPDGRGVKPHPRTGVVAGRMFSREKSDLPEEGLAGLQAVADDVGRVPDRLPTTSAVYSSLFDRLVVYSEIEDLPAGPYAWSVMQVDQGKAGSQLADWLQLPWQGPEQLILPGMHTAASAALRHGGTGDEIFLAACGLMATGARTILLSQWRVGGATTNDMTREFVQGLGYLKASDSWQRAIELAQNQPLIPDQEPRLNAPGFTTPINAEHPFFWSGYLLIDTGADPRTREK